MKLVELIEHITELRGQQFGTDVMTGWVNEIEAQAVDQVVSHGVEFSGDFEPYQYEMDAEKTLLIPERFQDVYINYLLAKIDFLNQETERYNNDVAMMDAAWKEYHGWYFRNHDLKPLGYFRNY